MLTPKQHVRNLLNDLPDDISLEELRLEVNEMEQTLVALDECERGLTIPHEVVMKEMESWLAKLNGRGRRKGNFAKSRRGIEKDSPAHCERVTRKISEKIEMIAEFPEAGREARGYKNHRARQLLVFNYKIVYWVHKERIIIARIYHAARNLPKSR